MNEEYRKEGTKEVRMHREKYTKRKEIKKAVCMKEGEKKGSI